MREAKNVVILVVDDEEVLRKAIVFDFKRKGFQVLEASNGNEALETVRNRKVDVVLSDVRMPGGDGIGLLDAIKAIDPGIPVVMLITGFADITTEDAYNKGADAIFSKPFDRKMLMAAVLRAISTKEEVWVSRKTERVESDFNIQLRFPGMETAIEGKVLNFGRGGMFVALKEKLPKVGARTSFLIEFDTGQILEIAGEGIVRWVRIQTTDTLSPGCGIEFDSLSDSSRTQVIELINRLKTRAYIPKT